MDNKKPSTDPTVATRRRIPIVPAYRKRGHEGDLFVFWCVGCKRWHTHGAAEGHRVAHCCTPAAWELYGWQGYSLREVGHWEDLSPRERRKGPLCRVA